MNTPLLNKKTAVVFGAGGSLGSTVAQSFADMGADVFASNRSLGRMNELTGMKDVQQVDVLNEMAVEAYIEHVIGIAGQINIAVNLAATDHEAFHHGKPGAETSLDQLLIPAKTTMGAQFVTAKAVYTHMAAANSGVIVFVTSTLAKVGSPWSAALSATHAGIEGLMKSLASEWGPEGIRVLGVRSEAMPETPTINYTFEAMGQNIGLDREEMQGYIEQNKVALKRLPSTAETANVIAFAASDLASFMTGTMLNQSGGHILE